MNTRLSKAIKCLGALISLGILCSVRPAVADVLTAAPGMTLVSTDTAEKYPFAAIVVDGTTYHVTEGDVLFGKRIVRISPKHVTFRNRAMLTIMRHDVFARIAANEALFARR